VRSTSELAPVHYSFLRGAVRQSERLFVDLELRIGHPLLHSQVVLDFVRHSRLCGYAAESGPRLLASSEVTGGPHSQHVLDRTLAGHTVATFIQVDRAEIVAGFPDIPSDPAVVVPNPDDEITPECAREPYSCAWPADLALPASCRYDRRGAEFRPARRNAGRAP
jgi:hypothetical protein